MRHTRIAEDPLVGLRAATRAVHRRVESHPLLRPLVTGRGLNRESYLGIVRALYVYYASLERDLVPAAGSLVDGTAGARGRYRYRPRAELLAMDLADLGAPSTLPPRYADPLLPALGSPDQLLGVLYVIEGATRGGRVVSPRLARVLGAGPTWAGRYFGLGVDQGDGEFDAFLAFLRMAGPQAAHGRQSMVDNARVTFETLHVHLENFREVLAWRNAPSTGA